MGDASAIPPEQWIVSVVCEAFGGYPDDAQRKLDADDGLIFQVLTLRAHANAFHQIEQASANNAPIKHITPVQARVMALQQEIATLRRSGKSFHE